MTFILKSGPFSPAAGSFLFDAGLLS